jgi:hypothetical protein
MADTPWFQSYLAFDPERVIRDVHQPIAILRTDDASSVAPEHADRLAVAARGRKRAVELLADVKALGPWLAKNME